MVSLVLSTSSSRNIQSQKMGLFSTYLPYHFSETFPRGYPSLVNWLELYFIPILPVLRLLGRDVGSPWAALTNCNLSSGPGAGPHFLWGPWTCLPDWSLGAVSKIWVGGVGHTPNCVCYTSIILNSILAFHGTRCWENTKPALCKVYELSWGRQKIWSRL